MTPQLKTEMERPTQPFTRIQYPLAANHEGNELLKTSWQQKWHQVATDTVGDQYGFTITHDRTQERPFHLQHRGTTVAHVYKITTAKLMSCILMNDILNNKPNTQHENEQPNN